jgi:hypothetical protein
MRHRLLLACVSVALLSPACDLDEESIQGPRSACGQSEGNLLGCESPDIETPEDACWRLVECGVIPLDHPENYVFDWSQCVRTVETMPQFRLDLTLACIQGSSCDQLKTDNSPENPSRGGDELPLCIQPGDT